MSNPVAPPSWITIAQFFIQLAPTIFQIVQAIIAVIGPQNAPAVVGHAVHTAMTLAGAPAEHVELGKQYAEMIAQRHVDSLKAA